ncbi:hypothetical protein I3843_11G045100 [Carya illinoinensis]|nr:hypothetical protein I3760_11G044600 [Carya illinoinensis]KAG6686906.1 hypothetical protein I3842_11G045100 [Carya illinoinensis]KAG7954918.1 hypothetical protein I3843_11G045100 [Carya illinoinensis]
MGNTVEDKAASPILLVAILICRRVLDWILIFEDFYLSFLGIIQFFTYFLLRVWKVCVECTTTCAEAPTQKISSNGNGTESSTPKLFSWENVDDDNKLSIGEVKMMMEKLGTSCDVEDHDNYEVRVGPDEIAALFEEEPSPEEVKEAFDMFDENNDGFIDAGELEKVLSTLGILDHLEADQCQKMISVFDENGDGRVDFNEFVKLLEYSFC